MISAAFLLKASKTFSIFWTIPFWVLPYHHGNLESHVKPFRRKKFYLFDCGATHALSGTKHLDRNSSIYGDCFEQFIINEIRAHISYRRKRTELSFWRTKQGDEVDLILDDSLAIEIKATTRVTKSDAIGIGKIADEGKWRKRILISQDEVERNLEGNCVLSIGKCS